MPWLTNIVALLGSPGAAANAAEALAAKQEAEQALEGFLMRFPHPAGRALVPVEPSAGQRAVVV